MKKIIALLAAAIMLLCTACSSTPKPGELEQSPETLAQMEVISTFGISQKNNRIIGFKGENDFIEYIVVMYNGDTKTSEKTYYFYNNDTAYDNFKEENAENPVLTFFDDARYVTRDSGIANTGTYDGDYMLLGKTYDFR